MGNNWYKMTGDVDVQQFPECFFRGVHRMDFTTAIRATDVRAQNYTVVPRHWFIDAWFQCERCRNEFCWTALEQQCWFEEYRFYVDSIPLECVACRGVLRALTNSRQQYDAEIAQTLDRDTSREKKIAMLELIDTIEKGATIPLPERIQRNRRTLQRQLQKSD